MSTTLSSKFQRIANRIWEMNIFYPWRNTMKKSVSTQKKYTVTLYGWWSFVNIIHSCPGALDIQTSMQTYTYASKRTNWAGYVLFPSTKSNHSNGYISGSIRDRDPILVSPLWFLRSRNRLTLSDLTLGDQKTRLPPIWRKFDIRMTITRVL